MLVTKFKTYNSSHIVMPQNSNPMGVMFGGVLLQWIDTLGAVVAEKYSKKNVATVHIDEVSFKAPIHIGDHVELEAVITSIGTTTMKIHVNVFKENPRLGQERMKTTSANLVFVALGKDLKPTSVR